MSSVANANVVADLLLCLRCLPSKKMKGLPRVELLEVLRELQVELRAVPKGPLVLLLQVEARLVPRVLAITAPKVHLAAMLLVAAAVPRLAVNNKVVALVVSHPQPVLPAVTTVFSSFHPLPSNRCWLRRWRQPQPRQLRRPTVPSCQSFGTRSRQLSLIHI